MVMLLMAGTVQTGAASAAPAVTVPSVTDVAGHQVLAGRTTTSLGGAWRFATDPDGTGESAGFPAERFDPADWDTLRVPGNWDVHDRYATYRGAAWYRRDLTGPSLGDGQVARLRFEAVYHDATVWLNGTRLGEHAGGYTPFEFDVTGLLRPGKRNVVVVRADNTYEVGAWYPWGGISRSVSLTVDPAVRIERQRVDARPDLATGRASVTTTVTVGNAGDTDRTTWLGGSLSSVDGRLMASLPAEQVTVRAGQTVDVTLAATLSPGSYRLWELDHPVLYRSNVALAGSAPHAISDRFGIRSVEVRGTGFFLNGEQVRLNGYNRIGDDRVEGNVEPAYLVRRDIDRMKAAGANLMRIHHVPQAPEVLDYADEKGLLLIAEVPVWGKAFNLDLDANPQPLGELAEMVHRDANHPSVFAWSVANEIAGNTEPGKEFVRRMIDRTRELDPSRLVTYVSNTYGQVDTPDQEAMQYTDFLAINAYGGFGDAVDIAHRLYPDRPVFLSEFSTDGYEFTTTREDLDFTTDSPAAVQDLRTRPYAMGGAQWTFNDYRSTFRGSSPNQVRGWGVQTIWGEQKAGYAQMRAANSPVRELTVRSAGGGTERESALRVTPRGTSDVDLPAFTLRGYRLAWQATDAEGRVLDGRILPLPDLAPGADPVTHTISWRDAGGAAVSERLTLLSPTGYEVAVTETALLAPAAPRITQTVPASGAARVVFDRVPGATSYRVEARAGDTVRSVTTERNTFADLTGLADGTAYQVTVAAVDERGATASAPVTLTPGGGALPPRLQALTGVEGGLVLGFVGAAGQTAWDIEVSDGSDGSDTKVVRTTSVGASRIEGLAADRTYTVRLRAISGAATSAWSERLTGRPLSAPTAPRLAGALSGTDSVAVRLTPAPRAIEYDLTATPPAGRPVRATVRASAVDLLVVSGLAENTEYTVSVRVRTAHGLSAPSTVTTRTTPMP
jgi:beta-galactosidase